METESQNWNSQVKMNTRNLAFWTMLWVSSMALATYGPLYLWESSALTAVGILINTLLGIGMILANIRHLKGLDEMQKKIQLEAMGIALGVGLVGGLSYSMLDTTNLITQDAEISFLVILIALTYLTAVVIGQKRYQ